MRTVNIHEARAHLSRLVEQAAAGEPFIIARAGKPIVRVVPLETPGPGEERRLGFMEDLMEVSGDFDRLGEEAIGGMFEGRK